MKKYKTPNIVVFKIHPFYVLQASKINASLRYRNSYVRYEERDEDRAEDFGRMFMDYYVTSGYEVTLLYLFESARTHKQETEQTRRFQLTEDGRFEEVVIEME